MTATKVSRIFRVFLLGHDEAANDARVASAAGASQSPVDGWDPFEVWRERVRDPRLLRSAPSADEAVRHPG